MPAYLVRTIKEHDLVGVFFASNTLELAYLIDEVLDPEHCEYRLLGPGGVIWDGPAVKIPLPRSKDDDDDDEEESSDVPWKDARFTELWYYEGFYKKARWRKVGHSLVDLYGIDPETPEPDPPPRPPSNSAGRVLPFRRRK
ncbi:hypothetical protein E4K64_15145 [Bradyrhizobium frederickii]|uniref:Uncharacterized protein n=1 Tax=Bradyrhizobium frederickii TaxID=2560054 RepID=A0A4Y9P3V4_9BRAD|nr:hypothetical protein [Bradyrhizobium frederickii]TFV75061.1 hypothetical protein E4K64_15145 [Bradyrhizobium frederickii]